MTPFDLIELASSPSLTSSKFLRGCALFGLMSFMSMYRTLSSFSVSAASESVHHDRSDGNLAFVAFVTGFTLDQCSQQLYSIYQGIAAFSCPPQL
jgi:hypothetical protein